MSMEGDAARLGGQDGVVHLRVGGPAAARRHAHGFVHPLSPPSDRGTRRRRPRRGFRGESRERLERISRESTDANTFQLTVVCVRSLTSLVDQRKQVSHRYKTNKLS